MSSRRLPLAAPPHAAPPPPPAPRRAAPCRTAACLSPTALAGCLPHVLPTADAALQAAADAAAPRSCSPTAHAAPPPPPASPPLRRPAASPPRTAHGRRRPAARGRRRRPAVLLHHYPRPWQPAASPLDISVKCPRHPRGPAPLEHEVGEDRRAMYDGWRSDGAHSKEWAQIANAFLNHAFAGPARIVLCPCCECGNLIYHRKEQVQQHLCKNGFMPDYIVWSKHGEGRERPIERDSNNNNNNHDRIHEMLNDLGRQFDVGPEAEERSTIPKEVEDFYRLLAAADEVLHESTKVTVLEAVTRLMSGKAKFNFSNECYNFIVKLIDDILPQNHKMPKDIISYDKIDACENNCMLFRKNGDEKLSHCKCCGKSRYVEVLNEEGESVTTKELVTTKVSVKQLRRMPIADRFKQLYLSNATAHPMRSIRFGLSTDGFTPFSIGATLYSCWPVFIVPYNLPPHLCMKEGFVFLVMVILGPKHPGKNLNVFLEPLIEELQEL
ncbi:hypothetical protein U9M48_035049 [Paspalum notatum var. saurae]|uniref:Transposase-associated domain-containing protein n=1 Tax=Paspalum notatum var. saurae TaxID=547442 RepID=A0AAQ3UEM1_PASNO